MASILDYLDWRGDITFAERAFNEVDNLLLAELSYLDFGGICNMWSRSSGCAPSHRPRKICLSASRT